MEYGLFSLSLADFFYIFIVSMSDVIFISDHSRFLIGCDMFFYKTFYIYLTGNL